MSQAGYTVEVTNLSPNATEKDVQDFFSFSGTIEHIEIVRSGDYACTAYVTFKEPHSLDTAVLLSASNGSHFTTTPSEAVTMAQEVVTLMLSKGYVLGKDALIKAKAFDESHHVSASAAAKIAELSKHIGLTDKINAGVDVVRSVDERYHVLDTTKTVMAATGRTAVAATHTVVNSSYFSAGALWVSGALTKAAQVAADLGTHGINK